ncbi:thioredoxin domain-containing protein 9-like [Patiria miniata]|uniref:Thioredoxin domain-containing protein 9 n=1 Tax=Patiria miniata TaxID=46514 RepID=A0A914AIV2_PATMI|nr:thioredoxin domain-containing protein 9-like [Patiria miniata]
MISSHQEVFNSPIMEQAVQQQVLKAAEIVEDQVDAELHRLDNMDADEVELLRQRRLDAMKKEQQRRQEWLAADHGTYQELPDEKAFFDQCKKSEKVVCHFYRDGAFRCKIVDKHLGLLAPKHLETRFLKINAEKSPFLAERLRIVVIPTIALVIGGKTKDYIVGFDDLGGKDDFPTEMLEWRLGCADVIRYNGNLSEPPVAGSSSSKKSLLGPQKKKTIRGGFDDDSDSDLE